MSDYWKKRQAVAFDQLNQSLNDAMREQILKQYERTGARLIRQISALYNKLKAESETGKPTTNDLYRYNRYYEQLTSISNELDKMCRKEIALIEPGFKMLYRANVSQVIAENQFSTSISAEDIEKTIKQTWAPDGKNWSDRIWADKKLLAEKLQNTLVDNIAGGRSVEQLTAELQKDLNVSYNNAVRLVRTESAFIQTQSSLKAYEVNEIGYYQVVSHTGCATECLPLNDKIYPVKKAQVGINCPPFHPNCRCVVIPITQRQYEKELKKHNA